MNRSTLTKLGFLFVLAISITACNKYDEGANFSLLTAKMRMTNTWTSTSYSYQTAISTSTATSVVLTVEKDGNFTQVSTLSPFPSTTITGTWDFNSDKTQLLLTNGNTVNTWDIIKLKNKELKLVQIGSILGSATTTTIEFDGE